jgi:hypothetical protein
LSSCRDTWRESCEKGYWKTLKSLTNLSNSATVKEDVAVLLNRRLLKSDFQLLKIIWPISMMLGVGITLDGKIMRIYNDGDLEIVELGDPNVIDDLVKEFTLQAQEVLGLRFWSSPTRVETEDQWDDCDSAL